MSYRESSSGILVPLSSNGHASSNRAFDAMTELYEASIRDLEMQLREQGWLRLNDSGSAEFDRSTIGEIVATARAFYLKNPLINRAVEVGALYVWGQDLSVTAINTDVQKVVDRFWKLNQSTLTGQQASRLLEVELEVTGNVFMALFADAMTGEVRVRMVPVEQIQEIVTNPDDRSDVWYYRRTWTQRKADGTGDVQSTAFYPDWRYTPKTRDQSVQWDGKDVPIMWNAPVCHVKAGAFLHWLWGVPEVYAALDWAKAYKGMLENDATRSAALAKFAYKMTTTGGAQGVAAAQARLGSTLGTGNRVESNPAPAAGSNFIRGSKDVDLEPVDVSRALMPVDHSRPIRLMTAAAVGLPETFFGDADVGNHATAKTLDRPTELRYNERRSMWRDVFYGLIQWVIDRDLLATRGLLNVTLSDDERKVNLAWPDLLEPDVMARVNAVKTAGTLDGQVSAGMIPEETMAREMMNAIGIEDIDGEIKKLQAEKAARDAKAAEVAKQMQQRQQPTGVTGPTGPTSPTGPTGTTGSVAEAKRPAWEAEVEVTDDDLDDAAKWFDEQFPERAGLLDAKVID